MAGALSRARKKKEAAEAAPERITWAPAIVPGRGSLNMTGSASAAT
jgi:hypothetical protein